MAEYLFEQDQLDQMDNNIRDMLSKGATQEDVMMYANDYKEKFVKKKDGTMGLLSSPSVSVGIDPEELIKLPIRWCLLFRVARFAKRISTVRS